MMPVAINYSFIDWKITYHFDDSNGFVTADQALDLGLINQEELAALQARVDELGWEDGHEPS